MLSFRVAGKTITNFVPQTQKLQTKPLYSLYEKHGSRWVRISDMSYLNIRTAWDIFGSRIAMMPLSRQIRQVTQIELREAR